MTSAAPAAAAAATRLRHPLSPAAGLLVVGLLAIFLTARFTLSWLPSRGRLLLLADLLSRGALDPFRDASRLILLITGQVPKASLARPLRFSSLPLSSSLFMSPSLFPNVRILGYGQCGTR